jgi:2,3-dihydroxybiphenyl 1,2-dioxygenase
MTSLVEELAYVVVDTTDVFGWERFARKLLGAEAVRDGGTLRLRLDERPYRWLIRTAEKNALPVLGWRVADAAILDLIATKLLKLGHDVASLNRTDLSLRDLTGAVRFRCHNGIQHEVAHDRQVDRPFVPPGDVTGFVTRPGGLGHAVWSIPDVPAMDRLMLEAFGMSLREDILTPAGPGHFYGCNARHHSLAVFTAPALRIEHLMAEMRGLDDVGRAMDRAIDVECDILQPLGRHRTDQMVSFYVRTPNGFGMEIGCGGILVGHDWEQVREGSRKRPWGHGAAMRAHHKKSTDAASDRP